jgi:hypothetical protein
MTLHRKLFVMSGLAIVMAAIALVGFLTRGAGLITSAQTPAFASLSDTTALILVTSSVEGELSPCG